MSGNKELCATGSDAINAAVAAVAEDKLIHLKLSPRLWAELCGVLASQPHAGVYPLAEGPFTLERRF